MTVKLWASNWKYAMEELKSLIGEDNARKMYLVGIEESKSFQRWGDIFYKYLYHFEGYDTSGK